ncbi:MAG: serine hydrolase domain-containing protein [Flavobacteriaceae bacterium]
MNKNKKIVLKLVLGFIFIMIVFALYILNETKDTINANPENIDEKIGSFYNKNKNAGFAVSIFNKNGVLYQKGFGYADLENEIPYTTKTQQYIASISKTTIGISLLKAEELGLLKLNDPINEHLPFKVINPKHPNKLITIKQLATHTSSLNYNENVVESLYIDEHLKNKSLKNIIENYFLNIKYGKISFTDNKPGSDFNYSNIGAGLAAYIIEYKSNMNYAAFTEKHIFNPIGLQNTHWFKTEVDSSLISKYYHFQNSNLEAVKSKGVQLYPARDLITNVEDLTTYCKSVMLNDPKVLSELSYKKLLHKELQNEITNKSHDNSGIFWLIDRNQYGITYQLTGMTGGDDYINTIMMFDPKTNLGYIFIGNTGGSKYNRYHHINIYRTLVSYGDYIIQNDNKNSFLTKLKFKWHNIYSRINGLF